MPLLKTPRTAEKAGQSCETIPKGWTLCEIKPQITNSAFYDYLGNNAPVDFDGAALSQRRTVLLPTKATDEAALLQSLRDFKLGNPSFEIEFTVGGTKEQVSFNPNPRPPQSPSSQPPADSVYKKMQRELQKRIKGILRSDRENFEQRTGSRATLKRNKDGGIVMEIIDIEDDYFRSTIFNNLLKALGSELDKNRIGWTFQLMERKATFSMAPPILDNEEAYGALLTFFEIINADDITIPR